MSKSLPATSTSVPLGQQPVQLATWMAAVVLVLLKLWLVDAQRLTAVGNASASLDDRLFVDLAANLAHGHWLGDYSVRTLAKGAAYPLFIAATHALHVPLPLAQQLLYATACAALSLAVAPLFRLRLLPLLIFAVLLFNPMSYETQVMGRVLRQHLSTSATLLALAGGAGLWLHARGGYYARLVWGIIGGVGLAACWLSREEAVLVLPALALLTVGAIAAHRSSWHRPPTWLLLAMPWLIWIAACSTVSLLNKKYYGAAITGEFRAAEFADAYGALTRVRARDWQPYVPVPREVRLRLYEVSPAFAELRTYFEGEPGRSWASYGSALTGRSPEDREIAGGWFMWALRDAVAQAGHAPDARTALAYYRQLANEINAACDDGRLDALPRRRGFVPAWNPAYRKPWLDALGTSGRFLVSFDQFNARVGNSVGDEEALALFREYTRAKLAPAENQPRDFTALERARLRILEFIARAYQAVHPWLLWLAMAGTLYFLVQPGRTEGRALFFLQLALAGTLALNLAAIALIHVSSFPSLIIGYFHGSYPLVLGFTALGLAGIADLAWRSRGTDHR